MQAEAVSLFNYQDDARSNKHKMSSFNFVLCKLIKLIILWINEGP